MYFSETDRAVIDDIRECIQGIKDACDRIINYKSITAIRQSEEDISGCDTDLHLQFEPQPSWSADVLVEESVMEDSSHEQVPAFNTTDISSLCSIEGPIPGIQIINDTPSSGIRSQLSEFEFMNWLQISANPMNDQKFGVTSESIHDNIAYTMVGDKVVNIQGYFCCIFMSGTNFDNQCSVIPWKFFDPGITLPSVATPCAFILPRGPSPMILSCNVLPLQDHLNVVRYGATCSQYHDTGCVHMIPNREFLHCWLRFNYITKGIWYSITYGKFFSNVGKAASLTLSAEEINWIVVEFLPSLDNFDLQASLMCYDCYTLVTSFTVRGVLYVLPDNSNYVVQLKHEVGHNVTESSIWYVTESYLLYSVIDSNTIMEGYSQFQECNVMSLVVMAMCITSKGTRDVQIGVGVIPGLLLSELFFIVFMIHIQWRFKLHSLFSNTGDCHKREAVYTLWDCDKHFIFDPSSRVCLRDNAPCPNNIQ